MKKLYVITRRDLSPGAQLAQSIHAVTEFGLKFEDIYKDWHSTSNHLVCLSVDDEEELNELLVLAMERNINAGAFWEPDLDDKITAICLEPGERTRKLCSGLSLALK